jgi:hypothetical protein
MRDRIDRLNFDQPGIETRIVLVDIYLIRTYLYVLCFMERQGDCGLLHEMQ